MRKSFKVIVLGIFIISTAMLMCRSGGKAYEKKMTFNSIDEIIEVLNNNVIKVEEKSGNYIDSNIFLECLSKRKRITDSTLYYSRINLEYNKEKNTEKAKKQIINEYLKLCKENLEGYEVPDKIEAGIYDFHGKYADGAGDNEAEMKLVFIDEGEGWVIDYFIINDGGEEILNNQ